MIEVSSVTKVFSGGKRANDDISFTIKPGEIFGLLGPNGAGKSTLLKLMTGVLNLDHGDIRLHGHSIKTEPLEAKKCFAFVSDSPDNYLRLTGLEYLNFICDIFEIPTAERKERIERIAGCFSLTNALGSYISTYSHGMRQKIMVTGALVVDPPIWILDEPLIGLDPRSAYNLKHLMREHANKGNIVLFSTHVLEVAQSLVDRLAIINSGKLIFEGTLAELQHKQNSSENLEALFLELTDEQASMQLEAERQLQERLVQNPFSENN